MSPKKRTQHGAWALLLGLAAICLLVTGMAAGPTEASAPFQPGTQTGESWHTNPLTTTTPTPTFTPICPVRIDGSITQGDPVQTGMVSRLFSPSVCLPSRSCPGVADTIPRHYDVYTFRNPSGSSQCITVHLDVSGCPGNLYSAGYRNSFDPSNPCTNFAGDTGDAYFGNPSYGFMVGGSAIFQVVVHELAQDSGCGSYTLTVSAQGACITTPTPTITRTPTYTPTPTETDTPTATPTCTGAWSTVPSPNIDPDMNYLYSVSAISATDVWAVGGATTFPRRVLILHWDGLSWDLVPNSITGPNNLYLTDVEALATNDVWAVGAFTDPIFNRDFTLVVHWDGTEWSIIPSPNPGNGTNRLEAVTAVSSSDVWAVGTYNNASSPTAPLILHWDGSSWMHVPQPANVTAGALYSVAASGPSNVWAVGAEASGDVRQTLVLRWDGNQWVSIPSPGPGTYANRLSGVEVLSPDNVWAVGGRYESYSEDYPLILHWNGVDLSVVPGPPVSFSPIYELVSISAVSTDDIWAVGGSYRGVSGIVALHWNGSDWSVSHEEYGIPDLGLFGVAAVSPSDVWAVGHYRPTDTLLTLVKHYDGQCSTSTPTSSATPTSTPSSVAILAGHVTWQGRPTPPSSRLQIPITLTLKMGSTEVNYYPQYTDPYGFFTVTVSGMVGSHQWRVDDATTALHTARYLANSGVVDLTGASVTQAEFGLVRAGDASDDNAVNVIDFTILRAAYGCSPPGCDERADFNGDGLVSASDFTLLRSNFGTAGAPPLSPGR